MSKVFISNKLMVMIICLTMLLPVLNLDSRNSNNTIGYLSEPNLDGLTPKALVPPPSLLSPTDGSALSSTSVTLNWLAVPTSIAYNVQVDTSSSFSSPFVDNTDFDTNHAFTAPGDDVYYWRARAMDFNEEWSTWSSTWDFTVDTTPPGAPSLVSPANGAETNDQTPYLDWSAPTGSAVQYHVQVDDSVVFFSCIIDILTSNTYYTCTTTLSEGNWYWRVCAKDAAGNWGSWSAIRNFEVDITAPGIPTLVSPTNGDHIVDNTPYFDWTSASGANFYQIQIDTTSSFTTPVRDDTTANTYYTSTALADNLYYWHVRAGDTAGNWGTYSSYWTVTVDTTAPGAPTLVTPTNNDDINDPTPYLDWSTVSGAVEYDLYVSQTSDFSVPLYYWSTASSSYTCTTLDEGIYYWHVRAKDIAGNIGSFSTTWKFTVDLTPPGEPALLYPANGALDSDPTPYLSWTSVADAVQYQVQVAWESSFTIIEFDTIVGNNFLTTPTLPEGLYYWQVRAQDSAGNWGDWSSMFRVFEIDTTAPEITDVFFESSPTDLEEVFVYCNVTDSNDIDVVTLHYRVNSGEWTMITMIWAIDNQYDVSLGTFTYADFVEFFISANDSCINPNIGTEDNGGAYYSFTVVSGDVTGPAISSIEQTPDPANELETITISCDVSDTNGIQSVILYCRINGGSWSAIGMVHTSGDIYEITIGAFAYNDEIEYYIVAVDDSPNHNETIDDNTGAYYSFTIVPSDVSGPTIDSITLDPISPDESQTTTISCSITDLNGVQSATLYYRVNGGSWTSTSMTNTAGSTYEATIPSYDYGDLIEYYITAVDDYITHNTATEDNGGSYYNFTVSASDVTGPIIDSIVHTPSNPSDAGTVTISCSVMDNNGVQSVTLYYRIDEGSWLDVSMTFTSGSTYEATIDTFAYDDLVEYYINATDAYVNPNTSTDDNSGEYYSFTVVSGDTTVPTIDDVVFNPNTPSNTDQVNITCTVSDINGIASVILHYRINGGSWVSTTMVLITGNQYKATIGPFAASSQIEFYITAIDDSPNSNVATDDNSGNYYNFTIETPITSTTPLPTSNTSLALLIPFIGALLSTIIIRSRRKQ